MPDKFDPYRDALVMEETTIWPADMADVPLDQRTALAKRLHAQAAACVHLEYVRQHTGFTRQITVTRDDLARLKATA